MRLWRAEQHERLTSREWDAGEARGEIAAIVDEALNAERAGFWPAHPSDELTPDERLASIYLGSAGVAWGLWKLGASFDAEAPCLAALEHYRREPDFGSDAHPPSLWMGETGVLVVLAAIGSGAADRDRVAELVHANRAHPTWELMWGSPGTILAARALGLTDLEADSAALLSSRWDGSSGLWTQDLYGRARQYLGPAHGFAANVHALRGHEDADALRVRVTRMLERTALRDAELVNWPPAADAIASEIRVQWCHGAPGIICTIGDLIPEPLLLGGGELIWRAGPLAKGSGLCHGTAGNGFALLRLYELTREELWLERARRFAMHTVEQVRRQRRTTGRGRFTLWTGDIGAALYLRACIDADPSFPTIDGFR